MRAFSKWINIEMPLESFKHRSCPNAFLQDFREEGVRKTQHEVIGDPYKPSKRTRAQGTNKSTA